MLNQSLSRGQICGAVATFVLCLILLAWGAATVRTRTREATTPIEMQPVREAVTATGEEVAPAAPAGPVTDEEARRQEALESLKAQAQREIGGK